MEHQIIKLYTNKGNSKLLAGKNKTVYRTMSLPAELTGIKGEPWMHTVLLPVTEYRYFSGEFGHLANQLAVIAVTFIWDTRKVLKINKLKCKDVRKLCHNLVDELYGSPYTFKSIWQYNDKDWIKAKDNGEPLDGADLKSLGDELHNIAMQYKKACDTAERSGKTFEWNKVYEAV